MIESEAVGARDHHRGPDHVLYPELAAQQIYICTKKYKKKKLQILKLEELY